MSELVIRGRHINLILQQQVRGQKRFGQPVHPDVAVVHCTDMLIVVGLVFQIATRTLEAP
jgi:hypothetical protein